MPTVFPSEMMHDSVWMDRLKFVEAENHYLTFAAVNDGSMTTTSNNNSAATPPAPGLVAPVECSASSVNVRSSLIDEITMMRANIKSQLESMGSSSSVPVPDTRVLQLEKDNESLKSLIQGVSVQLADLTLRVSKLEGGTPVAPVSPPAAVAEKAASDHAADDADDDFDLFGDDDEEEDETEEEKEKREALLAKYHEKKSKKPALIAKSNIILDVKPWDDETDMEEMERQVRTIEMDGLLWGNSKFVPLAYGIRKLQISCVVEDDKVGSDILSEKISEFQDYVQSVDVASFNKV